MSVPQKYRAIGDFHEYYSGARSAPYLTIFVGGNHEASNHLFELYYGGWVAPNIYYMGAANVIRCGPLRIAGFSGIWKGYDYRKPHFERLPYNRDDVHSVYHVRELDVRKLLQLRTQVDLGLSHDWPKGVEHAGNAEALFRAKRGFREDSESGKLGNLAAKQVLDRLRPRYWFSAHLHVRFNASISHEDYGPPSRERSVSQEPILNADLPHGLDGPAVSYPATPVNDAQALPARVSEGQDVNTAIASSVAPSAPTSHAISAWQNFHSVASQQEATDYQKFVNAQAQRGPNDNPGDASHQLTWRKVNAGDDLSSREVTGVRKTGFTEYSKENSPTPEMATTVKNSDEIDLDLSSDAGSPTQDNTITEPPKSQNTTVLKEDEPENASASSDPRAFKRTGSRSDDDVSQNLRDLLPASFKRQRPEPAVYGPLPEAISNKTTEFLALDKCEPKKHYLELMELAPLSDATEDQKQRPYGLQYDKEWLAITRVFADDLKLGDPNAQPSFDLGGEKYKDMIGAEEAWIEENVVKLGKLDIPRNFELTAPVYDPSVPLNTQEMPPEFNNPQTAEFCGLIGIENKFYLTDSERDAREAAGPRPTTHFRGRGDGGGRWAQRSGRGSQGRGGSWKGSRGRGRGHRDRSGHPNTNTTW